MNNGYYLFFTKKENPIKNTVVVFPFTYVNPHNALPPIAAEYLQAGILETGRNAILLDMRYEIDIKDHLETADLVCLFGHFEDCSMFVKRNIHVINEVLDQIPPQTPIVAGGTNFNDPEKAFELFPKVGVIILENPETCIMELLDGEQFEAVDNIAYRKNGKVIRTKHVINALPETIYPRRSFRNPNYKYHAARIKIDLVRAGNYKCKFCYQYGKDFDGSFRRWQGRSAQAQSHETRKARVYCHCPRQNRFETQTWDKQHRGDQSEAETGCR